MDDRFDEQETIASIRKDIEAETFAWLYNHFKNLSKNKKDEDSLDEVQDD